MTDWARRGSLALAVALLGAMLGCGGNGTTDGGGSNTGVDSSYNFSSAGALPGVESRNAGRGLISGVLLDSSQAAVAGVTVTLFRLIVTSRQVGSVSTTSGTDGRYAFGNLEPGQYRIQCQNQVQDATVVADTDTPANFSNVTQPTNNGGGGGGVGEAQFKWTLIIYLNADNDLEPFGIQDVNEMEMLPDSDDVAIVVLMDRIRRFDASNNDWTDTRRFRIRHDNDTQTMTSARSPAEGGSAEVLGELDTGNATTLHDFVNWAQTNYPAEHYLVDLWNHGAGWRHRNRAENGPMGRGVLFDDTQNTFVSTPELDGALNTLVKPDLVTFDSSLMQMMEVVYQIRNRCDFVVGSEESPPGEGYPYDAIFGPLVANPNLTPEQFAGSIVNNTIATIGANNSLTQSALRASQLGNLGDAVSTYANLLQQKTPTFASQIAAARTASQRYGSGSGLYEGNRDLIDFANQVANRTLDTQLASGRDALQAALNAALVAEGHTGSDLANSHGLAIFVPSESDWTTLRSRYLQQAFATDQTWDNWLDLFYGITP